MRKANSNNKLNESPASSIRYPSLEFAVSSQQGMRPYQEDEVAIQSYNSSADSGGFFMEETKGFNEASSFETFLFGIFDGHAGGKCSKYVSTHLPELLCSENSFTSNLAVALRRSFHQVNDQFLQIAERQKLNDGSTGLCVVIRQDRLTVSNVGDCRAVLLSNNCQRVTQLSIDQKPNSPKEKNRIISLGGYVQNCYGVFRVNGVLAVARAFGNRVLRQVIRPDAEITLRRLERDDDYIVIASDGLWDVLSNRDVLQICKSSMNQSQQKIANELTSTAIKRGSMDNVTVIVINLSKYVLIMPNSSITPKGSPNSSPHTLLEDKTMLKQDNNNNNNNNNNTNSNNRNNSPLFSPTPSNSEPYNSRLSPLGSNFGANTTFSNQWQDRSERSSLRPIPLRPQTTQMNQDNSSYRHHALLLNHQQPQQQQHSAAELSSSSSSSSNNHHNSYSNDNMNKNNTNTATNNNLKRSVNISSFDEFYNKQMAATKYSYNRGNSYDNNGNSTLSTLRSSLQDMPMNSNSSSSSGNSSINGNGNFNNSLNRTIPLRRPHTSSSSSSTINNSINKLNLSDEYIRTTSSSSSSSRMYSGSNTLNNSTDFFPSSSSNSLLRPKTIDNNNSNGTTTSVVRSSSAFRPRSAAALSSLK